MENLLARVCVNLGLEWTNITDVANCQRLLVLLDSDIDYEEQNDVDQSFAIIPSNSKKQYPLLHDLAQRVHRVQIKNDLKHLNVWEACISTWPDRCAELMLFCMVHSPCNKMVIDVITNDLDPMDQVELMDILGPLKQEFLCPMTIQINNTVKDELTLAQEEIKMHNRVLEHNQAQMNRLHIRAKRVEAHTTSQRDQIIKLEQQVEMLKNDLQKCSKHLEAVLGQNDIMQSMLEKLKDADKQLVHLRSEMIRLVGIEESFRQLSDRLSSLRSQHTETLAELHENEDKKDAVVKRHKAQLLELSLEREKLIPHAEAITLERDGLAQHVFILQAQVERQHGDALHHRNMSASLSQQVQEQQDALLLSEHKRQRSEMIRKNEDSDNSLSKQIAIQQENYEIAELKLKLEGRQQEINDLIDKTKLKDKLITNQQDELLSLKNKIQQESDLLQLKTIELHDLEISHQSASVTHSDEIERVMYTLSQFMDIVNTGQVYSKEKK